MAMLITIRVTAMLRASVTVRARAEARYIGCDRDGDGTGDGDGARDQVRHMLLRAGGRIRARVSDAIPNPDHTATLNPNTNPSPLARHNPKLTCEKDTTTG